MSAPRVFALVLTDGPSLSMHEKALRGVTAELPWDSFSNAGLSARLCERARTFWTEMSLSEYRSAMALTQLSLALMAELAPLDLSGLAARAPAQELAHAELCARMAMLYGGGAPLVFGASDQDELSQQQPVNDLIVSLCCVGETLSLHLLRQAAKRCTQPLPRAVLSAIVKDEAVHSQLGWMYLDCFAPDFDAYERHRLSKVVEAAIVAFTHAWNTEARTELCADELHHVGALTRQEHAEVGRRALAEVVVAPLRRYGIL